MSTRRFAIHPPQLTGRITRPGRQEDPARALARVLAEQDGVMAELQRFLRYLTDANDVGQVNTNELDATKAPTARKINTQAPLSGGGDLSTDRTLGVSTFVGDTGAGGSRGVVPAPPAGSGPTKFLKANGTWAVPAGGAGGGLDFATAMMIADLWG